MGVRIFLSRNTGNKEIETSQQKILMVLTTRVIPFDTIDISAPGMEEMRRFMRERGRKREGQRNVLPPQIFNGEEYRGDYEEFDIANEDDDLEEFLGIPRKNPKVVPIKTGAVAPEVEHLDPGKLNVEDIPASLDIICETANPEHNEQEFNTEDNEVDFKETTGDDSDNMNDEAIDDQEVNDSSDNDLNEMKPVNEEILPEEGSIEVTDLNEADEGGHIVDIVDISVDISEDKLEVVVVPIESSAEKDDPTEQSTIDNIEGNIKEELLIDNDDLLHTKATYEDLEDSSDESSDEDTAVEYMPDGELVRKKSRGFKQLNNCKRFWKASLMVG